jgi:hypothetical protein
MALVRSLIPKLTSQRYTKFPVVILLLVTFPFCKSPRFVHLTGAFVQFQDRPPASLAIASRSQTRSRLSAYSFVIYSFIWDHSTSFFHTPFVFTPLYSVLLYTHQENPLHTITIALNTVFMSSATNLVRERVTVQQRAEARAHIDFLRDQRSIPLEILKELQDEKPEYDPRLERITNFVNFTSGRLGSVLPM